jgi:8-oxo-dGTP pyrophosphatase MutT (NUDIX family)
LDHGNRLYADPASQAQAVLDRASRDQFGALCYRSVETTGDIEVLLITTRRSRRWTIPKGWPIDGKKGHQTAKVEAIEEAGVRGKIFKKVFGRFTYLKSLSDGQHVACLVRVYLLRVDETVADHKEQGQRKHLWCSCSEAAERVREPELKTVFRMLQEKHAKLSN